jgi:hypothetical protein
MPVAGAQVVMGDCLQILRGLPANRFDALVTDPPAGIGFMGKEWDKFGRSRMRDGEAAKAAASGRGGKTVQPFGYSSAPSLSQDQKQLAKVRGLFLDFLTPRLAECLRVCPPRAPWASCGPYPGRVTGRPSPLRRRGGLSRTVLPTCLARVSQRGNTSSSRPARTGGCAASRGRCGSGWRSAGCRDECRRSLPLNGRGEEGGGFDAGSSDWSADI